MSRICVEFNDPTDQHCVQCGSPLKWNKKMDFYLCPKHGIISRYDTRERAEAITKLKKELPFLE